MNARGTCDPHFSAVRDVFEESFTRGAELGAGVAIVIDGKVVVDLVGGHTGKARTRAWDARTLVNVYSVTKAWTAVCAHHLVEAGALDLDAPVAQYWPEFAQAGKGNVRVHEILSHRGGLPAIRAPLPPEAMYDWTTMTAALAAETPWWEPGTRHGYHPVTFGWLAGEIIRRASGTTTGKYFREHVSGPLGLDAHIGLAPEDDDRCATLHAQPRDASAARPFVQRLMAEPASMAAKAFANPPTMLMPGTLASRAWRGAELPSVNGHATAKALARFYGVLARGGEHEGTRVLSPSAIARATEERSFGSDAVLEASTRFGLGFMLTQTQPGGAAFGLGTRTFGHPGAGGALGFADPDAKIGFGFVTNFMGSELLVDPRATALAAAACAAI